MVPDYVDAMNAGVEFPPIHVDNGIIVDGNHRYIASQITGTEIEVIEWSGGRPDKVVDWEEIIVGEVDWRG